jgi:hypothetical protein
MAEEEHSSLQKYEVPTGIKGESEGRRFILLL